MSWKETHPSKNTPLDLVDSLVPSYSGQFGEPLPSPERSPEKLGGDDLSVQRAMNFAYGVGDLPPVVFPNAFHLQEGGFSMEMWEEHNNPESELARIKIMLNHHPKERSFPSLFTPILESIASKEDVLNNWLSLSNDLEEKAVQIFLNTFIKMRGWAEEDLNAETTPTQVSMVSPEYYSTDAQTTSLQENIWERSLKQIVQELNQGDAENVEAFLDLYSRMKDPISRLLVTQEQIGIFIDLYVRSIYQIDFDLRTPERDEILVTQLALESSMQASPGYKNIFDVRTEGSHELQYVYIENIFSLPKGELSNEQRVLEIIEEYADDIQKNGVAAITPLNVSYTRNPTENDGPYMFIVDGFHRLVSLMVLQYFYEHNGQDLTNEIKILSWCDSKEMVVEWKRDVVNALAALAPKKDIIFDLMDYEQDAKKLAYGKIPALLSQEQNFFTIAVEGSNEASSVVLVQPFHQAIYNNASTPGLAFPPKHQSHGRVPENGKKYLFT